MPPAGTGAAKTGGYAAPPVPPSASANTIYVCTRLRVRKTQLLNRNDFMRMMQMSIPQIARFIGEHGYAKEVHVFAGSASELDRVETALTENLATSFQEVRGIAMGPIKTLTDWFLHRWDIVNAMIILRAKRRNLDNEQVRPILVPAGDLDVSALEHLLLAESFDDVLQRLSKWRLYPVLEHECGRTKETCLFSRLENRLYQQYYSDLLRINPTSVAGAGTFIQYIRMEIDLQNFRNLLRLRTGQQQKDIRGEMIPGGYIPVAELNRIFSVSDADTFTTMFRRTKLHPLLIDAYCALNPGTGCATDSDTFIADRWVQKKRPLHEMETMIARIRLTHMEQLSKRNPFSVLPVLVYLERKKHEVWNIRAILRGIEDGVPAEEIQRYIVI